MVYQCICNRKYKYPPSHTNTWSRLLLGELVLVALPSELLNLGLDLVVNLVEGLGLGVICRLVLEL